MPRLLLAPVQAVVIEVALNKLVGMQLATLAVVIVDVTIFVLVAVIVIIAGSKLPRSLLSGPLFASWAAYFPS